MLTGGFQFCCNETNQIFKFEEASCAVGKIRRKKINLDFVLDL